MQMDKFLYSGFEKGNPLSGLEGTAIYVLDLTDH